VRPATRADRRALVTGNARMAFETEHLVLDEARLAAGVDAVLADPQKGFYLVAERRGEVVGHLLVTYEWSDWRSGWWLWIQSVYVFPEARRLGVYRALHEAVRARIGAHPEPVAGIRLYVERDNARAQATYAALGMKETAYRLWEEELARA
jgi:ribosomal protein S18 acetylase RimI-like enzyme